MEDGTVQRFPAEWRHNYVTRIGMNIRKVDTYLGHSPYDFFSCDSFVINRYNTSFSAGGSGVSVQINDTFLRFFPWYYLFVM